MSVSVCVLDTFSIVESPLIPFSVTVIEGVGVREIEREKVCVCVRERGRLRVCVCECVCVWSHP